MNMQMKGKPMEEMNIVETPVEMKEAGRLHVSDLIGENYKEWKPGDIIILDAGTGTGKTTFCIDILGKYARATNRSILYLSNRTKLKEDIDKRIIKADLSDQIDTDTFQMLESDWKKYEEKENHYSYIVADESHYFYMDSLFNKYTDVSYNWVQRASAQSVIIYASATAKVFFSWLIDSGAVTEDHVFRLSRNYGYVNKAWYYKKNELIPILKGLLSADDNSKMVVFCTGKNRMLEMYNEFGNEASYFCAKDTRSPELGKICNREAVHDETFDKRILFTTSALDNGVDLKNRNIKYMFSEMNDIDLLVQSLGRKRSLGDDDSCTFFIRYYSRSDIAGKLNNIKYQIRVAEDYLCDPDTFISYYGLTRDREGINSFLNLHPLFYLDYSDKTAYNLRVRKMALKKYKLDVGYFEQIKETSFDQTVEKVFGDTFPETEFVDLNLPKKDMFKEYLLSLQDKFLYKEEQVEVKQKIFELLKVDLRKGGGIHSINGLLDDKYSKFPLRFNNTDPLTKKRYKDYRRKLGDTDNPHYKHSYWKLE